MITWITAPADAITVATASVTYSLSHTVWLVRPSVFCLSVWPTHYTMPGHDPPVHILNTGVLIIVTSYKLHTRMVFWFDFNSERSYCGWFVDWWVWQRDERCWCVLAKYGFGISTLQKLWIVMAFPSYKSYSFMNTPRDYNSLDGLTYLNILIPTTGCGHQQNLNTVCTLKKK